MGHGMKRFSLLFIVVIMAYLTVIAADGLDGLAQQAQAAYVKGDFKAAADLYEQLVDRDVKTSEVYFNLGNAYYQLHDLGHALLSYRRAQTITPRDEDLRFNVARIRVQRLDGMIPETGILWQLATLTSDWFSYSELGWIVIVLVWVVCGCVASYVWRPARRKWIRWGILSAVALFILISALMITRVIVDTSQKPAVIISDTVSVMTGPGTSYLEIFELHAATEIRIIEARNHWIRFQLPDLREGWIDEQALEMI
jgi:tetratricopeptide (TPR) repeat protein